MMQYDSGRGIGTEIKAQGAAATSGSLASSFFR